MNPGDDCDAAETQREEDAERDDPRAKLRGHAEAAEDEQKQEQVVERQRALDHVDGGPFAGRTAGGGDPSGDCNRRREPAEAPRERLAAAGLTMRREQPELDNERGQDCRDQQEDDDGVQDVNSAGSRFLPGPGTAPQVRD
jgi:hypothetical protein